MSSPAESLALGLLDAGWRCGGVEFDLKTGTVVILVRTPPIPVTSTADYIRLIALATGKEH